MPVRHQPARWQGYANLFAGLETPVSWELLQQSPDSEVWRVTLVSGTTVIAKWGKSEVQHELGVIQNLLGPLEIRHASLLSLAESGDGAFVIMEDAGSRTLAMQPTLKNYAAAARALGNMRIRSRQLLASNAIGEETKVSFTQSSAAIRRQLRQLRKAFPTVPVLEAVETWIGPELAKLYETAPVVLVHNEFTPSNLVVAGDEVVAVDWAHARLSPHLADLYALLHSATQHHVPEADVRRAYLDAVGDVGTKSHGVANDGRGGTGSSGIADRSGTADPYGTEDPNGIADPHEAAASNFEWQLRIGGLCWLIRKARRLPVSKGHRNAEQQKDIFRQMAKLVDPDRALDKIVVPHQANVVDEE